MAKVVMNYDTATKQLSFTMDGQEVTDLCYFSFAQCDWEDNKPWQMSLETRSKNKEEGIVSVNHIYARLWEDQKDAVEEDVKNYLTSRRS